ncbi:MAG: preprotein translocase subunit SecA [Candidatus Roizmanbacteria bacterium]|nr:preprotein translocase subunit SecA [Candidatus Roizmanbacteria bacterium]
MFGFLRSFVDANARELKRIRVIVEEINALEPKAKKLKDSDFKSETAKLKKSINGSREQLVAHLPWAFALVREASYRTLGERHFDSQLIAGIALHEGMIAEQKTGEGKTLSATAPLYLNALMGKGVHLVTVNDYLARRDAGWMGRVFDLLGMTTAAIISERSLLFDVNHLDATALDWRLQHLRDITRKEAYQADITYGINSEFGFDYLRDNMAMNKSETVQRGFYYAIVDEVDSVLIDEARTPHIISAPYDDDVSRYYDYARIVDRLVSDTDYVIDEKMHTANLTERGIEKVEKIMGLTNIYETNYDALFHIEAALKAQTLFTRDRHYIVRGAEIVIVDEFTGRLLEGRRFSEGIHQAIEAKEGVPIKKESKTLATVSLQNYFRMYEKLAGMTGTAATEAEEFHKIYQLNVLTVPTNKPITRADHSDYIYKTERGKFTALVEEIAIEHAKGRPILVGTTNIEKNEVLSSLLKKKGIRHEVLNAKNHEREATIISNAGKKNAVTIATNMAGRGVDIILGGTPANSYDKTLTKAELEKQRHEWKKNHDEVVSLGGLYVMGTERHESRRIDNQLRGRAGRQGDPGETRFFIALEDDMLRVFGGEQISKLMGFFNFPENQPIEHPLVSKSIEQAQVKVEGFHFDSRKHLLDFDDVLTKQRDVIYARRQEIIRITEERPSDMMPFVESVVDSQLEGYRGLITANPEAGKGELMVFVRDTFAIEKDEEDELGRMEAYDLLKRLHESVRVILKNKEKQFGKGIFYEGVKIVYLSTIDYHFTEHLTAIENLREGINLRGYAQLDPLVEYKKEAFRLFDTMLGNVRSDFLRRLLHLEVQPVAESPQRQIEKPTPSRPAKISGVKKLGRNDPCWCNSGKKWKNCHYPKKG